MQLLRLALLHPPPPPFPSLYLAPVPHSFITHIHCIISDTVFIFFLKRRRAKQIQMRLSSFFFALNTAAQMRIRAVVSINPSQASKNVRIHLTKCGFLRVILTRVMANITRMFVQDCSHHKYLDGSCG